MRQMLRHRVCSNNSMDVSQGLELSDWFKQTIDEWRKPRVTSFFLWEPITVDYTGKTVMRGGKKYTVH